MALYGSLYWGSDYTTGPFLNILHVGNSNLGQFPYPSLNVLEAGLCRAPQILDASGPSFWAPSSQIWALLAHIGLLVRTTP